MVESTWQILLFDHPLFYYLDSHVHVVPGKETSGALNIRSLSVIRFLFSLSTWISDARGIEILHVIC
jgi:hypothetical protein